MRSSMNGVNRMNAAYMLGQIMRAADAEKERISAILREEGIEPTEQAIHDYLSRDKVEEPAPEPIIETRQERRRRELKASKKAGLR